MEAGMEAGAEAGMEAEEDDLNLDEIIRELEEGDMSAEEDQNPFASEGMYEQDMSAEEPTYDPNTVDEDINSIIEAILSEEEDAAQVVDPNADTMKQTELEGKYNEAQAELHEAYRTVKHLKSVINEVNLLNAKLLYTNKLFRNFDLNEGQKMKVIENFDRAFSTREAKLVFATLAESFNKPQQKRKMVKESAASRASSTTAPSRQTTQILSEGFEMANRWKKLAGLI